MKVGLAVEVIKTLIADADKLHANPLRYLIELPSNIDCSLTAFLVTYTGLYRVSYRHKYELALII